MRVEGEGLHLEIKLQLLILVPFTTEYKVLSQMKNLFIARYLNDLLDID